MVAWREYKNRLGILCRITMFAGFLGLGCVSGQVAPVSPDHPWHSSLERQIEGNARGFRESRFGIGPDRTYSLAELIDLAEAHNPETRVAWERARAQAAALGVARSELYPMLAAVALAQTSRIDVLFGPRYYRQTLQSFEGTLDLEYTVFDFGARSGRIRAAAAEALASNFGFNDAHRRIIFQVEQAYYQVLNASGQEDAARASLTNAQTVEQSAEARLKQGLATLPDVLEARSATALAQYELQSVLGTETIARGELATALGDLPNVTIRLQALDRLSIPESTEGTVDQAIDRAFGQRPDLMQQVAAIRAAQANAKEARAAFFPTLTLKAEPSARSLYGVQQTYPWGHTAGLLGNLSLNLSWTVFDGGARKNNLARAKADVRAAEAEVSAERDRIANEIWTAYSNVKTAMSQRRAAAAFLEAAGQSYAAALESYNYGVRNLLDVTATQKTLAQARSTDVLARTQVLTSLADLAFRTGDAIQPGARSPGQ
ncbi:MAG: TolC family protein [Pirellulales bacterium]